MASHCVNSRGQISIEYILLVIILLIYLQSFVQPVFESSIHSSQDVAAIGQASAAARKLAQSIDFVGGSPADMKQTISFYLPANTTLSCSGAPAPAVQYTATISLPHPACNNTTSCSGSISVLGSLALNCGSLFTLNPGAVGGKYYSVMVYKQGGVVNVAPA